MARSLSTVPALGLVGGIALYLLAHVAFRLRIGGGLGRGRPIASVVLLGLLPVATVVPAVAALGLVAAVCVSLIAYEALRYREAVRQLFVREPVQMLQRDDLAIFGSQLQERTVQQEKFFIGHPCGWLEDFRFLDTVGLLTGSSGRGLVTPVSQYDVKPGIKLARQVELI